MAERPSRASGVADYLRAAILDGIYQPGERIRQEAVAQICNTSRIPVREALQQLQHEGLVTLTTNVGARVAALHADELDEIYLMRERLEPLAVAHSTPGLRDDQITELWGYVARMESLADGDGEVDTGRWIELDRQFHLATFSAADMPRLLRVVESLWDTSQQYRRAYSLLPEKLDVAETEHRLLVQAIERRDAEDAERIALMHIRRTRLALAARDDLFAQAAAAS